MRRLDPDVVSIWLVPQGEDAARLSRAIDVLAGLLGAPRFAPHLTLLGGIQPGADILPRAETLAAALAPIRCLLEGIAGTPDYYRCLFLPAQPTPDLRQAHRRAREAWPHSGASGNFLPHVSLLYAHLSQEQRAQAIARCSSLALPDGITAQRLEVWATAGVPETWRPLATYELGPEPAGGY